MKLYGGLLSPYVMRVVLAARYKGIDLELETPEGGLKTPAYLALNPIGKMPTLIDGDFVLPESEVIAQYIDDVADGPSLLPGDDKARARARLISRLVDVYMAPHLGALFGGRDPEATCTGLDAINACLGYIEHFRGQDWPHLAGEDYSLADCTLIPMMFFLDALGSQLGTASFISSRPGLAAWWARVKASPSGSAAIDEMSSALQAFITKRASQQAG